MPVRESPLGHELIRVVRLLKAAGSQVPPGPDGADVGAYPILFLLEHGSRRLSDLAAGVRAELSTTSRHVSALVALGLVEKVTDPDDGRALRLSLSASGHAALDRIRADRDAWLTRLLEGWSTDDVHTLTRLLERFGDDVARVTAPEALRSRSPQS